MKKTIQYMTTFLLLLVVGSGCQDNENWKIITDVQPGVYITGSATAYSATAVSSQLTIPIFDPIEKTFPGVLGVYTWLKKDGEFSILSMDKEGNSVTLGKGEVVETTLRAETSKLVAGGPAYKVAEDGLYYVIYNSVLSQLNVLPVKFGIIGDATPGAWDKETSFTTVRFDEGTSTVYFEMEVSMRNKEMKFRYGDWGIELPYDESGAKAKIHTNLGANEAGDLLGESFVEVKGGGENFKVATAGIYAVTVKYELRSTVFSTNAIYKGLDPEVPVEPAFPEKLYIVGDGYKGWPNDNPGTTWSDLGGELMPVNGTPGSFWMVAYLNAGEVKFSPELAWKGDFGISTNNEDAIGEYTTGTNNIKITTPGHYLIYIKLDKDDAKSIISITLPNVYVIGDCANKGWDDQLADVDKFIAEDETLVSPALQKGNLRMCIKHPLLTDWWKAEFNIYDGVIEYRGNGGEQAPVVVAAGQKAVLNFIEGTAAIQ